MVTAVRESMKFILTFLRLFIWVVMMACMRARARVYVGCISGGQRTICEHRFSIPTVYAAGMDSQVLKLWASSLTPLKPSCQFKIYLDFTYFISDFVWNFSVHTAISSS